MFFLELDLLWNPLIHVMLLNNHLFKSCPQPDMYSNVMSFLCKYKKQGEKMTTEKCYFSVLHLCLPNSEGGQRKAALFEMNQCASRPSQWLERLMVMFVRSPSILVMPWQQVKNSHYSLCEAGCRFFQCWESVPSVESK